MGRINADSEAVFHRWMNIREVPAWLADKWNFYNLANWYHRHQLIGKGNRS
jgi:hypothetical protein